MPTLRATKKRIKTSKNISQVTRAMEMISAVKMRRAQDSAIAGREYLQSLENMMQILVKQSKGFQKSHYLNDIQNPKKVLVVLIAPKKGLCGSLITNLQRELFNFFGRQKIDVRDISFLAIGKKSLEITNSIKGKIVAEFEITEKETSIIEMEPITLFLTQEFDAKAYDSVFVCYSSFVSTMTQNAVVKRILPISKEVYVTNEKTISNNIVLFEPSATEVLDLLVKRYLDATIFQYYLESVASEHSARMVAMKNAHDSAKEIVKELTLFYNKVRQNIITTEIADSVSSRLSI